MLAAARGAGCPYYLRDLNRFDAVTVVQVGPRMFPVSSADELAAALRALRQARSDGAWPGHVSVVRDGRTVRLAGGL